MHKLNSFGIEINDFGNPLGTSGQPTGIPLGTPFQLEMVISLPLGQPTGDAGPSHWGRWTNPLGVPTGISSGPSVKLFWSPNVFRFGAQIVQPRPSGWGGRAPEVAGKEFKICLDEIDLQRKCMK